MVRLWVLGELRLEVDGQSVELPSSRKARLLLARLAVERHFHGRGELAGGLWPDVREDSARASLRNALAQLRKALGNAWDEVVTLDGVERLALAPDVWTDLAQMESVLAHGTPEAAVAGYSEPLLAGFDDEWVQEQRDELRDKLAASLHDAAMAAEAAGDTESAIRLSRVLTGLDSLAETSHRDLIRRLAAAGDRGGAVAAYERLRQRLADELSIVPSAATRDLVDNIRVGADGAAGPAAPDPGQTRDRIGASVIRYARSGERSIAYQRFGNGPAELIVVPGWASNLDEVWDFPPLGPLFSRLGQLARCTIFDKRGTGLSERDLAFGSLEDRASDIGAVLDAADVERATVFAYSESAALALVFAAAFPERTDRLILYSSYARLLSAPDYPIGFVPEILDAFIEQIRSTWGVGTFSRFSIQHAPDTAAVERVLARWERSLCTPTMAAQIIRANADIDVRPLLATVNVPTLVLHSSGDPLTPPEYGRYVAEHLPDARYVEHAADYHLTWNGEAAWFLDEVAHFLGESPPQAGAASKVLATIVVCRFDGPSSVDAAGEVGRFSGTVVRAAADELVARFTSPSQAVACAAALAHSCAAGVHAGEVEACARQVAGPALEVATEIAAAAAVGEVLVSRTVRDLTAGSSLSLAKDSRRLADNLELFAYGTQS